MFSTEGRDPTRATTNAGCAVGYVPNGSFGIRRGERGHKTRGLLTGSRRLLLALLATIIACAPAVFAQAPSATAASGTNPAANLDQCQNGGVGNPPTLNPCLNGTLVGTSYSDWVNGNVNGSKAHWKEGDFLPYRANLTGLPSGTITLNAQYDTIHGGKHALDYIGSFDATETTSPTSTPSMFHRNDNNPCFDKLGIAAGSGCTSPGTAPSPFSVLPTGTDPNLTATSCGGSAGGPITRLSPAGTVDIFAGSAATAKVTKVTIGTQTASGTGQCSAPLAITFTLSSPAPAGGWNVVLAWAGHIASQGDWGVGNSASAISGSPYHMALDSIVLGTGSPITLGSQDRALATSAIFFTPTVVTTIKDAGGTVTSVSSGDMVHDTAVLTPAGGFAANAGGTVIYNRYSGTTCATGGTLQSSQQVNVTNGLIPDSSPVTVTSSISYQAVYGGDSIDIGTTGACEPLTVNSPGLQILKTADAASVSAGTSIGYTITVTSTGPGDASNVLLSDPIPAKTGMSWTIDPDPTKTTAPGCTMSSNSLSCTIGTLGAVSSVTVHVTSPTTKDSCGSVDNTATATATGVPATLAEAVITVLCASVHITKVADAPSVSAGDPIGFTVTVNNTGAGTAHGVTVSDPLPTNAGLSWSFDQPHPGWTISNGVLGFGPADLLTGASTSVHITSGTTGATATPCPAGGKVDNTANVTTTNDGSDQAEAVITVLCVKVEIAKTADSGTVNAGDTIGFKMVVTSDGPGDAKGVVLTDPLPTGVGLTWSMDAADTTAPNCSIDSGTSTLTCNIGSLAALASVQVHVTSITTSAQCAGVSNTGTVTATNGDGGNSTASITVNCFKTIVLVCNQSTGQLYYATATLDGGSPKTSLAHGDPTGGLDEGKLCALGGAAFSDQATGDHSGDVNIASH